MHVRQDGHGDFTDDQTISVGAVGGLELERNH